VKQYKKYNKFRDVIGILLEDDKQLEFHLKGYSMFPLLRPGDTGVVRKCTIDDLKSGDIVVFYQQTNLVAHRFIRLNDELIVCKGDKNRYADEPVKREAIVGKLVHYKRGDKVYTPGDKQAAAWLAIRLPRVFGAFNSFQAQQHSRWLKLKSYSADFRANFRLAYDTAGRLFNLNAVIAILQGLLPFTVIVLVKWLVDLINSLPGKDTLSPQFIILLVLTCAAFLLSSVLSELKGLYGEKLSQQVTRTMYGHLHRKHITLELSQYESPTALDKMHRAVQEASFRPVKLLNEVQHLLKSIAASLFLVGIFISIRWYLVLILLLAIFPGVLLKIRYARQYHHLKEKQSPLERKMFYFNRVLTGFPFAKEMKLFGFSGYFLKRFRKLQDNIFNDKLKIRRKEVIRNIFSQTFAVTLIFATLAFVAFQTLRGVFTIGTVVLFFFAFQRGYTVLNELFRSMANLLEDTIFMNDFRHFLEGEHKMENSISNQQFRSENSIIGQPESKPTFTLNHSIRLENVSFRYATSTRDALQSINLTIQKGETVAIVGANGSGKTTLIKLLCGFYRPYSGKIYYDSSTTEKLGRETICNNLSAVFQDFALYNVTANENIALGAIHQSFSEQKVKDAAGMAGIAEVIEKLPDGYKTLLGNQFLGGEELSIGQWQKLAIARAFYRDSDLLLMDEPSSALDAVSEQQIIETLRKLAHQKTAVIISHRLSTVRWADRIVVFDEGKVAEEGTHDQLMQKNGTYAYMYQQATRSLI
jgi:ATP-binding cassette subfamily B protein